MNEVVTHHRIFGTVRFDRIKSKEELRQLYEESVAYAPKFFAINLQSNTINEADFSDILELLTMIRFGKEKYPYLLTLHVERTKITEVSLWKDRHYQHLDDDSAENRSTAILLPVDYILDFDQFSKNPHMLPKKIHAFTDSSIVDGVISGTICIAGTDDARLVLGRPDPMFFKGENPVFSILAPVED